MAGESQAADVDDSLLCDEHNDYSFLDSIGLNFDPSAEYTHSTCHLPQGNGNTSCGISEWDNLELDTPPDFELADLPFGSQETIFTWLDRL